MIGYTREEMLEGGLLWKNVTPPERVADAERALEQLGQTGVATPWESETLRKDGTRVPILVGAAMLDYPQCIAFTADLTERKLAEAGRLRAEDALHKSQDQLRQAQKMEAVGRLAGGVAHDFNNILSIILSCGELALRGLRPADPVRRDIEQVCNAAESAARLTQQLLMFSRQHVVETKVVDLHHLVATMETMLQRILGEDVELVTLPPSASGRVRVDPSHLEQVILNLIVNARDAMPRGGKVTIEAQNVELDESYALQHPPSKAGPHVMLAVSDTGSGMDRETQQRIFEPFFTTKEVGKGTGLGLSTVFGIVQHSGGSIWVYSELGHGTTFKIFLPRVDAEVDAPRPRVSLTTLRGSETILVVEDEEILREVVVKILQGQGYQVIVAGDGAEALLVASTHAGRLDLLLSDVVMPKMSGPELAKRLAVERPETKLLCMSGYTDDRVVHHGLLETVAFIQKPITPTALATQVRKILDEAPRVRAPSGG
jgi:two-component system, cell cycle sensor histidine kinase and response regulator CckA